MLLSLLLLLQAGAPDSARVYVGRSGQLDVRIPRIEADATIDGALDEPAWAARRCSPASRQYAPNDGLPAADSTAGAGVVLADRDPLRHPRVRDATAPRRATLADRDRIFADDNVQILLGTFHDGRQALMFAVNPLGVQGDGALVEGRTPARGGFIGGAVVGARAGGPEPGLRVPVEGPRHAMGLRGRGADPVQEPALPAGPRADLEPQRRARR